MAVETKLIPTRTEFSVTGNSISITSIYDENLLPDTISSFLSESVGIQDGSNYIEGDLVIQMKEYQTHLYYDINSNGELVQVINTGDELKYEISSNGDLIYLQ